VRNGQTPTSGERAEALSRLVAGIGLAVGVGAAISPRTLLRVYGVDRREVTGAGAFGWRLFATRNLYLGTAALSGQRAARQAFLPVQILDQIVFALAYRTRAIPRPAALLAMTTSATIIMLDLLRRAAERP